MSCHGITTAVIVFIATYTKPPKTIAIIIIIFAFLGEKLNSSAACGIESKPTNAQGAIATIEVTAVHQLTPLGYEDLIKNLYFFHFFAIKNPKSFGVFEVINLIILFLISLFCSDYQFL